jgi:hypothetical protein
MAKMNSILGIGASGLTDMADSSAYNQRRIDAYNNGISPQVMPQSFSNVNHQFNFEQIENGWVIHFRGKKWMVADLDELKDKMVAILVEYQLEK